ncbi:MAG: helix-turn-helix domain-containing protein [Faecousia sp.]
MDLSDRVTALKSEKEKQHLSIQQMADMSGVSAATVSRTLAEKTEPSVYTLDALEKALGLDVELPEDGNPLEKHIEDDPLLKYYFALQESRIERMRAHYNMILTEKNRWIKFLFVISLLLVFFICFMLVYDVLHLETGYIQFVG